jgi:hypothetical protein
MSANKGAAEPVRLTLRAAAVSCIRLPETRDGKEGVDGSSPSEGSATVQHVAFCVRPDLQGRQRAVGMEPFMELSRSERRRAEARLRSREAE